MPSAFPARPTIDILLSKIKTSFAILIASLIPAGRVVSFIFSPPSLKEIEEGWFPTPQQQLPNLLNILSLNGHTIRLLLSRIAEITIKNKATLLQVTKRNLLTIKNILNRSLVRSSIQTNVLIPLMLNNETLITLSPLTKRKLMGKNLTSCNLLLNT